VSASQGTWGVERGMAGALLGKGAGQRGVSVGGRSGGYRREVGGSG